MGKLIIFTAPSGAGKTTIVRHLLERIDSLAFSVSATTRPRRAYEVDGRDYYFISPAEFKKRIEEGAFIEWEEVYDQQYYGTLRSEVHRLWAMDKHIIFDIDVKGAMAVRQAFPESTLSIFVKPPSREILFERLKKRKTESEESLRKRIAKAEEELRYENKFDVVLVNDVLPEALKTAERLVRDFIEER